MANNCWVRLQEKFVIVETILKDDFTPAEISERIRQIATDYMAKSAVHEDIVPEDKPFGEFKRNNVSRAPLRLWIQCHLCFFCFAAIQIHVSQEPVCQGCVYVSLSIQM
jgi:hypothetical protein